METSEPFLEVALNPEVVSTGKQTDGVGDGRIAAAISATGGINGALFCAFEHATAQVTPRTTKPSCLHKAANLP
jgi:hypothetical protein